MKLICKNYGLISNTEVENEDGRILVTNGLDIKSSVDLWRWYYNIPFFEKIELLVSKELYNSMKQKPPIDYVRTVEELFYDNGVIVVEKKEPYFRNYVLRTWLFLRK